MDRVAQDVANWIRAVAKPANVVIGPPTDGGSELTISLHLHGMRHDLSAAMPRSSATKHAVPLSVVVRFLVCVSSPDPAAALAMLSTVVFAALEKPGFRLDLDPPPPEFWLAHGVRPQPSFIIEAPCVHERPGRQAKPVREVVLKGTPLRTLEGVVVDKQDKPISGVTVDLPALELTVRTDNKGRFIFAAVPRDLGTKTFRLRARGKEISVRAPSPTAPMPFTIRFPDLE